MTLSRYLLASMLALTVLATSARAEDPAPTPQVDIKRDSLMRDIPDSSVADKKIYVLFEDSPKMTMVVRERLRSKGLAVTENPDEADVKYQMMGTFSVSGRGREAKSNGMVAPSRIGIEVPRWRRGVPQSERSDRDEDYDNRH